MRVFTQVREKGAEEAIIVGTTQINILRLYNSEQVHANTMFQNLVNDTRYKLGLAQAV